MISLSLIWLRAMFVMPGFRWVIDGMGTWIMCCLYLRFSVSEAQCRDWDHELYEWVAGSLDCIMVGAG